MGTFAFPFVVFAKQGFVLFYLRFDFVESFLAARANMFAGCGSVESSRGKGKIQCQRVFIVAGKFCEYRVELHQIGLVGF